MTPIELCPTSWKDPDGFTHKCLLDSPHVGDHECPCGQVCEQLVVKVGGYIDASPQFVDELRRFDRLEHRLTYTEAEYADRLAAFIVSHIGIPYTAAEAGQILEIRGR